MKAVLMATTSDKSRVFYSKLHNRDPESGAVHNDLTHWDRDKMAGTLQTTFWQASVESLSQILLNCHWNVFQSMVSNIGWGNGLVPSGNKPLPETLLTQIYDTIWHRYITTSQYVNRLTIIRQHWNQLRYTLLFSLSYTWARTWPWREIH